MGMGDGAIGIISSIMSMGFLFNLTTLVLMKRLKKVKKLVIVGECLCLVFFAALYLLPFLDASLSVKTFLAVFCITAGYLSKFTVSSILYKWANDFVAPEKRATFTGFKEMTSVLSGIGITLGAGLLMDRFAEKGDLSTAFLIIAVSILIFDVCCFVSLMNIQDAMITAGDPKKQEFRTVLKKTLGNRSFRHVIIMTAIADASRYTAYSFYGTYKNQELMMSMSLISIVNVVGSLMYVVLAQPVGRYSDRTSYAKGLRLCYIFAAAAYLVNVFCTPKTWYLMIVFTVLFGINNAGRNANTNNILYSYVDAEYFPQAMAIRNAIAGLIGFLCALGAGKLLTALQDTGNQLFGVTIYGQQILSLIAFLMMLFGVIYDKTVVEKQKIMLQ